MVTGKSIVASGGCLCGGVRYSLTAGPSEVGYCHCRMCQRFSGAPVMAFATVALDDFVVTQGEPARRRSSAFGERWFCRDCGSPLAMRVDHQPDTIDFTVASLDAPQVTPPAFHIWESRRISWFEVRDHLPRYAAFRPHTVGLEHPPERALNGAAED